MASKGELFRRRAAVFAAVLLAGFVIRLPWMMEPLGIDQGIFVESGLLQSQGEVVYRDFWENKPLGFHLLLKAGATLFPDPHFLVIMEILSCLLAALLSMVVLRPLLGLGPAAGAGLLYVLIHDSYPFGSFRSRGVPEVFLDVPALLIFWSALRYRQRPHPGWLVLGGLGAGAAFWVKYTGLAAVLIMAPILLFGPPRALLTRLSWTVAGALAASLPFLGYIAAEGIGQRCWEATVTFNLRYFAGGLTVPVTWSSLPHLIAPFPSFMLPLYLFSILGMISAWRQRNRDPAGSFAALLALLCWVGALAQVFAQSKFHVVHYIVLVLPLSLMAAHGLALARSSVRSYEALTFRALVTVLAITSTVPPLVSTGRYWAYRQYLERARDILPEVDFLRGFRRDEVGFDASQVQQVARSLREATAPEEPVLVFSGEASILVLSGRRSSTRFYFDCPLVSEFTGDLATRYKEEFLQDLRARPPARIAIHTRDGGLFSRRSSMECVEAFPEFERFLRERYVILPERIGPYVLYRPRVPATIRPG